MEIGNYTFKKGEKFGVSMMGLHFNSNEWQRPYEFLPERFDPNSDLFLTPAGKKRNPFSFFSFSGGRRICLGKTLAEYKLKYMCADRKSVV